MKLWKAILCVLIVSLLVSMAIPMAYAKKPPKPPPDDPPADPAIAIFKPTSGPNENQIVVMNDDGTNQAMIYQEYFNCWGISWSPDATSLAWCGYTYVPNVPESRIDGVWRIDVTVVDGVPQGSNLQLLVNGFFFRGPAWSPLGDEIAFAEVPDGPGQDELCVVPADGGPTQVIYTSPSGCTMIKSPTWNSAGTHMAFAEVEESTGDRYMKVIEKTTGMTTHTLLKGQFYIEWVDWARQGSNTLAFYDAGTIYTVDIEIGTATSVLEGGILPSWSPDNSKIVYQKTGRKPKICSFEFSTGDITTLTNDGSLPDWRRF